MGATLSGWVWSARRRYADRISVAVDVGGMERTSYGFMEVGGWGKSPDSEVESPSESDIVYIYCTGGFVGVCAGIEGG